MARKIKAADLKIGQNPNDRGQATHHDAQRNPSAPAAV